MHRDAVNAVADFGVRVGNVLRVQAAVDRLPCLAGVVGPERAGGRNGDVHALGISGIEYDRVQAHAAGAGLPLRSGAVAAEAGHSCQFLPPSVERKIAASSMPA